MLSNLLIEETLELPMVDLNLESKVFQITGRSLPENPSKFYEPIVAWFKKFELEKPVNQLHLEFTLEYYNTGTAKNIHDIFIVIKNLMQENFDAKIVWHYYEDDEDMLDSGKDLSRLFDFPFEFVKDLAQ